MSSSQTQNFGEETLLKHHDRIWGGFAVTCPAMTTDCLMMASIKDNFKGFGTDSNINQ